VGTAWLPEIDRQITETTIGRDQVLEVRRAGARQANDEDRSIDDDVVDLRITLQELAVLEAVRGRMDARWVYRTPCG
jgi:hypothetical protein